MMAIICCYLEREYEEVLKFHANNSSYLDLSTCKHDPL